MQETKMSNIIKVRADFIDLIGHLEKININYVDINELIGFIYIDPKNEFKYKISQVVNNKEVYTFQYIKSQNNQEILYEDIPNAIFNPNSLYDFDLDLENKTFKKIDEFKTVDHIIINMRALVENIHIPENSKNKNIFRKILGC